MLAIRKWLYKPKKSDNHPLVRFYFADLDLIDISKELDSFDGRQDPERCTVLVNRLRTCQDRVLVIIEEILHDCLGHERASREFRAKFPDDVLQETLWGQLWFGAECLAAGSVILNREIESAALRPLARFLTRTIDSLRMILRDQCYKSTTVYSTKARNALRKFDEVFAEFELSYVSAMVPVKTALEYDTLQDVIVMFCETVERALSTGLVTQDEVDDYEAALMVTIPRLAILSGLVIFPDGPLNMDSNPDNMSELFRPFYQLLFKISDSESSLTDNVDAQEIKMAIQAAEIAARQEVRSRFSSSSDLVHRLFVCISGVADHLQTNYASDLRGILKTVFEVCAKNPNHHGALPETCRTEGEGAQASNDPLSLPAPMPESPGGTNRRRRHRSNGSRNRAHSVEEPPPWTADDSATNCLACQAAFTVLRRKHHCRNCGKIFCARCSANAVPLPRYGQTNPVRVCNRCYMFQVTPFQP